MPYSIGIDPGLSGAVAGIWYEVGPGGSIGVLDLIVADMPTYAVGRNGKNKNEVDENGLFNLLAEWAGDKANVHATYEQVGATPQMGTSSAFSFGMSYAYVRMALCAVGLKRTPVLPLKWKRAVGGLGVGATKDASRRRATELFPTHASLFSRVKDDGRAEAALIAYYGAMDAAGRVKP